MPNKNLSQAKKAKNDEFYTQYEDIQREVNAYLEYNPDAFRDKVVLCPCDDPEWSDCTKYFSTNFEVLGLKKLISTSYAPNSKPAAEIEKDIADTVSITAKIQPVYNFKAYKVERVWEKQKSKTLKEQFKDYEAKSKRQPCRTVFKKSNHIGIG